MVLRPCSLACFGISMLLGRAPVKIGCVYVCLPVDGSCTMDLCGSCNMDAYIYVATYGSCTSVNLMDSKELNSTRSCMLACV